MNPAKITLLTLGIWVLLTIICIYIVEDVSENVFSILVHSFYIAPIICAITFIVSLFFYPFWIKKNKLLFMVISAILILWILYIVVYLRSLFNINI